MRFETNSYFHIGSQHLNTGKPCQDYVLSEAKSGDRGYVLSVLSDGCSSGGKTDVGARVMSLLTHNIVSGLRYRYLFEEIPAEIHRYRNRLLGDSMEMLGLDVNDMLATSVLMYITPIGGIIYVEGDGAIALVKRSGEIEMELHKYEWHDNKPFYPIYRELDNCDSFIQGHGGNLDAFCAYRQTYVLSEPLRGSRSLISLREGIEGFTMVLTAEQLAEYNYIAIFSDGIMQIPGMRWTVVVRDLLAFKSTEGEFAKRRMTRFIRDLSKDKRAPIDDISYAVVRIIHDDENAEANENES